MPQFPPGQAKIARAPITVEPAGLACSAELYLGAKVSTSGVRPFTSSGAKQDISFPITMPDAGGTFPVYLDIFAEGQLIGAYKATEDMVIATELTTLYGRVTDANTGYPLEGAYVELLVPRKPHPAVVQSTDTDVNGKYLISDITWPEDGPLTPGSYLVRVGRYNYASLIDIDVGIAAGSNELNLELERLTDVEILSANWANTRPGPYGYTSGDLVIDYEVFWRDCANVHFRARSSIQTLGEADGSGVIGTHQVSIPILQLERINNIQYNYFDGYATQMYKVYKL